MTTPEKIFQFCPTCHLGNWRVMRDPKTEEVEVSCGDCGRVFLTSKPDEIP